MTTYLEMATVEQLAELRAQYDAIVKQQEAGAPKGEIKKTASALAKTLNDLPGTTVQIKRNRAGVDILADVATRLADFTPGSPAATDVGDGSPAPSAATNVGDRDPLEDFDAPDELLDLIGQLHDFERGTVRLSRPDVVALAKRVDRRLGGAPIPTEPGNDKQMRKNRDILAAIRVKLENPPRRDAMPQPVPEPAPADQELDRTPAASQQAISFGLATFSAARSLATGAAGLLGVPGTTSAVVDAQRAEQEEELDNSLPEDYSTEGQPLTDSGYSAAALGQWSEDTARAIDAQRANPDTQAAMAGAAIEALAQRATSDEPSPHEVRAITAVLAAATQTTAPSPVRDFMLGRIQRAAAATQTTGPAPQANQAEFLRARAGLTQAVGTSPEVRRLDPQFSSVGRQSVAVGSPLATAVAGTQTGAQLNLPVQANQPALAAPMAAVPAALLQATRDVTAAVADAAQRGELNAVQLAAVEDNLKDAPLTAQMVAQGRLKPHQVLDPAEVASYEQALTEQRVKVDREGRETVKRDTRLAAQPVLTRYVEDARIGGKRYRPPRFAGPAY
jgi:hypothetical protein